MREAFDVALETYQTAAETLAQSIRTLVDAFLVHHGAWDEQEFLLQRFDTFSLQRAALVDVGRLPDDEDEARRLFAPLHRHWQMSGTFPFTAWQQRLRALEDERWRAKTQGQQVGYLPLHRSSPGTARREEPSADGHGRHPSPVVSCRAGEQQCPIIPLFVPLARLNP